MASINKTKLASSVITEIKRMITDGELKEGDKLPNQHEFAARLGVSRTVLREALQTLTMLGVVEQRPKYGTTIKAVAPLLYTSHLEAPFMDDPRAGVELLEARRFIEMGAVELAVQHATPEQIQNLEVLLDEMQALLDAEDTLGYSQKNLAFHLLIAEASHNRFLAHLLTTIRGFMEKWTLITVLPVLLDKSLGSHREIYTGIKERNQARAVKAMAQHINDFKASMELYFSSKGL